MSVRLGRVDRNGPRGVYFVELPLGLLLAVLPGTIALVLAFYARRSHVKSAPS